MNTISITRLATKNNIGTRAVLREFDSCLLMEYRDVSYGFYDWVCVDIVKADGFDWQAWLLDKENQEKYTGVVKIGN